MNASDARISASDVDSAAGSSTASGSSQVPGFKPNAKAATQATIANLKEKSPRPSLAAQPSFLSNSFSARSVTARLLGSSNGGSKCASHNRTRSLSNTTTTSNSVLNPEGKGTFLIFNYADAIFISDLLSQDKEPCKSINLGNSTVTCHAFDEDAIDGHDLLIGLQTGEVISASLRQQLGESGKKLTGAHQYNKDGCVNNSRCTSVAWVPGGNGVFIAAHADGNIYVYDKNKESTADPNSPFVKDSNNLFVSQARNIKSNPIARWHICEGSINGIAFSSDGKCLATVGRDGFLRVFDYKKEQLVCGCKSYYGALLCCAWSGDGKYIAIGGEDDLVQVWSVMEKRTVAWGEGHNSWVRGVSFDSHWSGEGNGNGNPPYRFGSVGEDTQLLLWDLEIDEMAEIPHRENEGVLQTVSGMRDIPKLTAVVAQRVHSDALSGVVFTPQCVLAACRDGHVKGWSRPDKDGTQLGSIQVRG